MIIMLPPNCNKGISLAFTNYAPLSNEFKEETMQAVILL
jgi:hypothetical protein